MSITAKILNATVLGRPKTIVRVTPSLKSKNSDEFFLSLLFLSGTAVSP